MGNLTREKLIKFLAKFEKKYESSNINESDDLLIERALYWANEMASVFEDEPFIVNDNKPEKPLQSCLH
jgi:hypothetical protein